GRMGVAGEGWRGRALARESAYPPPGPVMRRRLLVGFAVVVALVGIGWGLSAWIHAQSHVTTDDAYVESAIAPLAAKVAGHVVTLDIVDNQAVKAGQLLLRIDPPDYEARRDPAPPPPPLPPPP